MSNLGNLNNNYTSPNNTFHPDFSNQQFLFFNSTLKLITQTEYILKKHLAPNIFDLYCDYKSPIKRHFKNVEQLLPSIDGSPPHFLEPAIRHTQNLFRTLRAKDEPQAKNQYDQLVVEVRKIANEQFRPRGPFNDTDLLIFDYSSWDFPNNCMGPLKWENIEKFYNDIVKGETVIKIVDSQENPQFRREILHDLRLALSRPIGYCLFSNLQFYNHDIFYQYSRKANNFTPKSMTISLSSSEAKYGCAYEKDQLPFSCLNMGYIIGFHEAIHAYRTITRKCSTTEDIPSKNPFWVWVEEEIVIKGSAEGYRDYDWTKHVDVTENALREEFELPLRYHYISASIPPGDLISSIKKSYEIRCTGNIAPLIKKQDSYTSLETLDTLLDFIKEKELKNKIIKEILDDREKELKNKIIKEILDDRKQNVIRGPKKSYYFAGLLAIGFLAFLWTQLASTQRR